MSDGATFHNRRASRRKACWLGMLLALGSLPALLGRGIVAQVASMYELSRAPYPYFQPDQAVLLYIVAPLVALSSFVLFLMPGALWVLALGGSRRWSEFVLLAFGGSLLILIVLTTLAKLVLGPLSSALLLALWLGSAAAGWLALGMRRAKMTAWPLSQPGDRRRALWTLAIPVLAVVSLLPKIFWENFNEDGIEAFEFGRSLTTHLLPYWDLKQATFGFYHNYLLFAYPNHWFISLFGPIEAAARLPFALYLAVLFSALLLLIEWRAARELKGREEALLLLGLATFAVTIAFNGTYDPYFADIAEPAAPDTLIMVCFSSAAYFFLAGRMLWAWIYAFMTYTAGPNGLLLLVLLGLATYVWWPERRRQTMVAMGRIVLVCGLLGLAYELIYNPLVLGGIDSQYSAKNLLRRIFPPELGQFARINLLLFPSGILPALALAAIGWQDAAARALSTLIIAYFSIVYIQSWTSLHQFAPVMVLPLAVFWRLYLGRSERFRAACLPALALSTLLALWLSLPRHFGINQTHREFGYATAYRVGDYEQGYPLAVRCAEVLYQIVPGDWKLYYPDHSWGMDHHSWIYYAMQPKPAGTFVNYVVRAASDPPAPQFARAVAWDSVALYIRDLDLLQRHLSPELPRLVLSPLYEPVLRETSRFFRAYMERAKEKELEIRS